MKDIIKFDLDAWDTEKGYFYNLLQEKIKAYEKQYKTDVIEVVVDSGIIEIQVHHHDGTHYMNKLKLKIFDNSIIIRLLYEVGKMLDKKDIEILKGLIQDTIKTELKPINNKLDKHSLLLEELKSNMSTVRRATSTIRTDRLPV